MIEECFNPLTSALPEPTLLVSSQGTILEGNDPAASLFGVPPNELQGTPLSNFLDAPEDKLKAYLGNCARSAQMVMGSFTVRRREDDSIECRTEGAVIRPWSPDEPALMILRLKEKEEASRRFLLLNQKIDELGNEIEQRKRAEERLQFLNEASIILAQSPDYENTLRAVADLLVPHMGDWCAITMLGENGQADKGDLISASQQVVVEHKNNEKRSLIRQLGPFPLLAHQLDLADSEPSSILKESVLFERISDSKLVQLVPETSARENLKEAGCTSAIVVPIRAHGQLLGAITLGYGIDHKNYKNADLQFAEELAHRAGLHIANARLLRDTEIARQEAEQMNRLKSAFLANMSHEIRTPLTSIIGLATLLSRKVDEEHREYADRIEKGGKRLMDTLNAVLTLSKLESGEPELDMERIDLREEVKQAVRLFEQEANRKGLELNLRLPPESADTKAHLDPGGVSGILQNLIGNAIKYTEEGEITVELEIEGDDAILRVTDTGIGIEKDSIEHIFDPFWQESTGWSRAYEGAGIGLSITRRMAEFMNGSISVESEKNVGTRFTVRLPKKMKTAQPDGEQADSNQDPDGKSPHGEGRFLVVEDNEDTRYFIQNLLQEHVTVDTAASGEQALELISKTTNGRNGENLPWRGFILDINLGNQMDGVQLLKKLREREEFARVPALAITAYAMPGDREQFINEGFDFYLEKPFTAENLLEMIGKMTKKT